MFGLGIASLGFNGNRAVFNGRKNMRTFTINSFDGLDRLITAAKFSSGLRYSTGNLDMEKVVEVLRELAKEYKVDLELIDPSGTRVIVFTAAGAIVGAVVGGQFFGVPGILAGAVVGGIVGGAVAHLKIKVIRNETGELFFEI